MTLDFEDLAWLDVRNGRDVRVPPVLLAVKTKTVRRK